MNTAEEIKVWDPLVRIFHWGLAAAFFTAYLTEDDILTLHTYAGYTALGLVAFRLAWGFVGPRHARFSDFVKRPAEVFAYLKAALTLRAERHIGHNPAGGAMVVALLVSVALTAASGIATLGATEFTGPLAPYLGGVGHDIAEVLEELHEFFANFTLLLVAAHLAGVALASWAHRENLPRAMVTGRKKIHLEE
ncbi:cytochrome b/b6 domain-containing protein [Endothiovibrio diazotrophicus]